jgi:hypothetical protein
LGSRGRVRLRVNGRTAEARAGGDPSASDDDDTVLEPGAIADVDSARAAVVVDHAPGANSRAGPETNPAPDTQASATLQERTVADDELAAGLDEYLDRGRPRDKANAIADEKRSGVGDEGPAENAHALPQARGFSKCGLRSRRIDGAHQHPNRGPTHHRSIPST